MKENPKIDELLNSFIDGELTAREQTEIQRLITHDAKIAQRLRQLQKCKMLVSSLPVAEAPDEILEDIKASLERRTLLGEQPSDFDERAGARRLLVRKVLAATAMIGLVAVLAAVVYTILTPETVPERPVAIERRKLPGEIEVVEPRPPFLLSQESRGVAMEFSGRLELKTSDLVAVDAFINKAIEDNGLGESVARRSSPVARRSSPVARRSGHGSRATSHEFALSCSREDLNLLLADLGSIWEKFDSATLFVETEAFGRQIAVDEVTAEQIAEIVNQDSLQRRTELTKDFAVLNSMAKHLPGREILDPGFSILDSRRVTSIWNRASRIPKPAFTSRQKTTKRVPAGRGPKPLGRAEDEQLVGAEPDVDRKVHLAIVVAGSE